MTYIMGPGVMPFMIKACIPHTLSGFTVTRLCENETNLKIIQDIMGHKDISTTMEIYAEATKEAKAHSFANLNGKLGISV